MLAFFPWLRLGRQPIQVGAFELIPYVRGEYAGPSAAEIDAITSPFREVPDTPIAEATLLRCGHGELLADLDPSQIDAAFLFSEMIALAGLANRRYFVHDGYSNRDNFRLIVQAFDEPGKGVLQRNRRRDGTRNVFITAPVHRVPCPGHVDPERVEIDLALLRSLDACRGHANAPDFVDSMITFNLANTDSSSMSPHVELVLISGALEKVLGCRNGKEEALAAAFVAAIVPRFAVPLASCTRAQASKKLAKAKSVLDLWVRDLFCLRGDLAHGKVGPEYPSIWTVRDHLLLASFVFPLVLKAQLARAGLYSMSESDQLAIDAFESLACASDLFTPTDEFRGRFPWNDILRKVADDECRRSTIEALERMDAASTADPER